MSLISINLTIFNKAHLLPEVLGGIFKNTFGKFEFIAVCDGCTDNSSDVLLEYLMKNSPKNLCRFEVLYSDNVFETKSNNLAMKASKGEHIIVIQDDQIITSYGYDERLLKPFKHFSDVFATTGRTAHNYAFNENSKFINSQTDDIGEWSDIVLPCDIADKTNTSNDVFQIRSTVNRGPLCISHADLQTMGYLDEIYAPQEFCEHDLMMRMHKKLGKVCGFYNIDWWSKPEFGGTRDPNGHTKRWLFEANHKNSKIFYERHKDEIKNRTIENRVLI